MTEYDELVIISNTLTFVNVDDNNVSLDIQCILNSPIDNSAADLLQIDHGIVGKRDIAAYGGALATASNPNANGGTGGGAIMMGHGFKRSQTYMPPADPPLILLTDEGFDTLYIVKGTSIPNGIDSVLANMKLKDLTASNIYINKLHTPDYNTFSQGEAGQVLVSQGPENSPIWVDP